LAAEGICGSVVEKPYLAPAFARRHVNSGVAKPICFSKEISVPAIRKILFGLLAILTVVIVVGAGWLWQVAGVYGFNTVLRACECLVAEAIGL
jgi:hypothetical protein